MMLRLLLLLLFFVGTFGASKKGVLSLDSWTFDKIVDGSKTVLVLFDKDYSYGEQIDAFDNFAKLVGEMGSQCKNFIIAKVGKTDYGEKKNIDIHERFDVRQEDFPLFKLFKEGKKISDAVTFTEDKATVENLSFFVQSETGIWFGLPGCLKEYDELVTKFMQHKELRTELLAQATSIKEKADKDSLDSAKAYVRSMKKIIAKGDEFIDSEIARVKRLKGGKLSEKKKKLFDRRLNILSTFKGAVIVKGKEEL